MLTVPAMLPTMEGSFDLIVKRPHKTEVYPGNNIFLNTFWNAIMTADWGGISAVVGACVVGTGSSTPAATQSALDNQIASTTSTYAANDSTAVEADAISGDTYSNFTKFFSFPLGSVVGNITELGVRAVYTATPLITRALVRDPSGNPIAVTVTAEDQLYVAYRIRQYATNFTPYGGSFTVTNPATLAPVLIDYLWYPIGRGTGNNSGPAFVGTSIISKVIHNNWGLLAEESNAAPAVTYSSSTSSPSTLVRSPGTYIANTFYRDDLWTFAPNSANFSTGIGRILVTATGGVGGRSHALVFPNNKLPKNADSQLKLTIRYTVGS